MTGPSVLRDRALRALLVAEVVFAAVVGIQRVAMAAAALASLRARARGRLELALATD